MPLIVICGRPCVGKTSFSRALFDALVSSGARASLVSAEEGGGGSSFCGDRARVFADAPSEKAARAWLRAAVERALTDAQLVVIADCGAGVKGFRYELYCAARNVGARSAVVWVGPDVMHGAARIVNGERRARETGSGGATAYADAAFDGLWARFEPPDARNRWDSPLVRVNLATPSARASDALLAAAASRGQLSLGSDADGASAFWEKAMLRAPHVANGVTAGPFLTSRFELRQVFSAAALASEQSAGATVESTVGATRRRARQAADALAGYGDVPTYGFSRTSVARERSTPDYFTDNFNADTGSENDDDIANLRDFDGIDETRDGNDDDDDAPPPLPTAPVPINNTGSFRRPVRTSATVTVDTGTSGLVVALAASSVMKEETPVNAGETEDAIMAALTWLVGFAHGRSSDASTRLAAAVGDTVPAIIFDEDARAAAAAASSAVLASLDSKDLSTPGVFDTMGVSFRLPRGTSTQELSRLRRAYLQPANDVGKGDAAAFVAFCYKSLRQKD